jgi:hypothetical protein
MTGHGKTKAKGFESWPQKALTVFMDYKYVKTLGQNIVWSKETCLCDQLSQQLPDIFLVFVYITNIKAWLCLLA